MKEKLNTVKILGAKADRLAEFYKDLLAESVSPHRIVIEDDISRIRSERSRDEFAIILQVACIISILRSQHWRAEDIAVLIPVVDKAAVFRSRYNSMTLSEKLIDCTADAEPEHCVCDSVRRFSGMDKPCVILVEPSVNDWSYDLNAFEALGMSRAMAKLIIIEKQGD